MIDYNVKSQCGRHNVKLHTREKPLTWLSQDILHDSTNVISMDVS